MHYVSTNSFHHNFFDKIKQIQITSMYSRFILIEQTLKTRDVFMFWYIAFWNKKPDAQKVVTAGLSNKTNKIIPY
jgi:hypothetical protein